MNRNPILSESSAPQSRVVAVCVLLFLASALNYMDRLTLANAAERIRSEFGMNYEQYGTLEAGFGGAFTIGSLVFGWLADWLPLRYLYGAVVLLWSGMGIATGYAQDYQELLVCRTLLGFFEAGHWPCGIKTVRSLLAPGSRAMGNSVLQSGTSFGAILTPLIMAALMTDERGAWRIAFQILGAVGLAWAVAWVAAAPADPPTNSLARTPFAWMRLVRDPRLWVILITVSLINTTFQMLRAWLPTFLQTGRLYTESQTLIFNSVWFAATDVGCLGAGAVALLLVRQGWRITNARLATFFGCACLALTGALTPWLESGWLLLGVLLVMGAGALGVFPIYHAFSQDISHEHQGKVTGIAGVAAWGFTPVAQILFGRHVDETKSYDDGLAIVCCLPIVAFAVLALFWPRKDPERH